MRKILFAVLVLGFASLAQADVWKWVDANGDVHFVDSKNPIYTWVDENGDVHYSDTPDHEDAVSVQLVWVSPGNLRDAQDAPEESQGGSGWAFDDETPEQRAERERAEAYYCKRATEIYDSYANAPRLYKTDDDGERVYLDEDEVAQTLEETRAKRDELCR